MQTISVPPRLLKTLNPNARNQSKGIGLGRMNVCLMFFLTLVLLPGLTPLAHAQTDIQTSLESQAAFCGEQDNEVIYLSRSSLTAESLQQLQRQQGQIKLVVDRDRIELRDLKEIAADEIPLLIDLSTTSLTAREIRELIRNSSEVQVLVNRDRIKAKELRTLARSGASFIIDVGTTSISPRDIRSLQRSLRQTAKDLEILVTSDRISPQDLRSIARGGAKIIFDVGATRISLSDIMSVHRQKGQAALFVTANRFDEKEINRFIRAGGHIVGSPFCL